MASHGYDDIRTPESGKNREFGVRRRKFGASGGVENARDGRDAAPRESLTPAFERAKTINVIGRQQQPQAPVFEFGDRSHMPGQRPSGNGRSGTPPPKYVQNPRGIIRPGAAIMERTSPEAKPEINEEEKRLKRLVEPPRQQDGFLNNLMKLKPAPRMRVGGAAPAQLRQTRKMPLSLEAVSTPSSPPPARRSTTASSRPSVAAASKTVLRREEWQAPVRLKRDQEAPPAERPKRNRVDLTPPERLLNRPTSASSLMSGGAQRVSSRLTSRQSQNSFGIYDRDEDEPSQAKSSRTAHTRTSYGGNSNYSGLSSLSLRRSTRATKEKTKEGTEDMPIHLVDSDEEEEEDASQVQPTQAVDDEELDAKVSPGEVLRDFVTDMEGYRVWFGHRPCRLDFHIHQKSLWLRSIRGVGSKWGFEREYKIPFTKIRSVAVYRLDESQAGEFDKTDPAGKVMATTSFIAFQFAIPDTMKKAEWREFYDPSPPVSTTSDSKCFFIAVAGKDDRNGSVLATLDDCFQPRGIHIRMLNTLDEVRPFATTMLANDLHYIFCERSSALAKESKRSRRRKDAEDDMDATQLTYPLPPCNMDIVTITRSDISRLQPAEYLNDNIIDYYLKRLLLEDFATNDLLKQKVLFLSSHFYSRLRAGRGLLLKDRLLAGYKNVSTWLTRSNLFSRSLVFIPINKDMHWSMAVIVNPKCAGDVESETDDPGPQTCIALLDPLGSYHSRAPILRNLKSFLNFEWERVTSASTYRASEISSVEVRAPLQSNSYDCGVYVLKYAQEMLKNFAELLVELEETGTKGGFLVPREITDDGLAALIAQDAFASKHVTQKRHELQELVAEDTKRYEAILESR